MKMLKMPPYEAHVIIMGRSQTLQRYDGPRLVLSHYKSLSDELFHVPMCAVQTSGLTGWEREEGQDLMGGHAVWSVPPCASTHLAAPDMLGLLSPLGLQVHSVSIYDGSGAAAKKVHSDLRHGAFNLSRQQ
ncbi:hypothetical protein SRHO_G00150770 [Serrasalmus rhombeus]